MIEWVEKTQVGGPNIHEMYSGDVKIATISLSRIPEIDFTIGFGLPGVKQAVGTSGTLQYTKEYAENVFKRWLAKARLMEAIS